MKYELFDYRVRTRLSAKSVKLREGKLATDSDRRTKLEGACRYYAPDGQPLCIYLPGAIKSEMDDAYPVLTTIRGTTENRGLASATEERVTQRNQKRGIPVTSSVIGMMDATGYYKQCRLTSWTNKQLHTKWPQLFPLFQACARLFEKYAPQRYEAQMRYVERTPPEWCITDTPYTTCTINNSYPTGYHQDDGDLDEGFSCLAIARRGKYTGGILTLPEYGLGVDLQDGDFLLMNSHAWHGNTRLICACGKPWGLSVGHAGTKPCPDCGAERISVVLYYRTQMTECGTQEEEESKFQAWAEKISRGDSVNNPNRPIPEESEPVLP
jgi:hypothetical protein